MSQAVLPAGPIAPGSTFCITLNGASASTPAPQVTTFGGQPLPSAPDDRPTLSPSGTITYCFVAPSSGGAVIIFYPCGPETASTMRTVA